MMRRFLTLGLLLLLGSCTAVPRSAPPAPGPAPLPPVRPQPVAPPSAPTAADWTEWPLAPGNWTWRMAEGQSRAEYRAPGGATVLSVACVPATRLITIQRSGSSSPAGTIRLHTSFGAHDMAARGSGGILSHSRDARDPLFDDAMFSRGRIAVTATGAPPVALPAWPEIARVVEDCR